MNAAAIPLITPGALSEVNGPTEESMAREWVHTHQKHWRFDHGVGRWFRWDTQRWRRDEQLLAYHLIGDHLRAVPPGKASKSSIARSGTAKGVESFAKANPRVAISHEIWDVDHFLLGTPGGTVDLRTGELRDASPDDSITRSTSVAPASGEPKRWLQFIEEATDGDADLGRFLQRALGYCLTGSTREHALFFIYGAGKNGKSVLLNTATRILGDYATAAGMETFAASRNDRHPTELARLDGARLVAASETEEGRAWAESRIKQLTGGDRIAARFMNRDFFEFTPRFKLFIVGNFQPVLHNVDAATKRRFNIIPFVHTPQQPDLQLEEKLTAEHPQILAWLIAGAVDWHTNGLGRPKAVAEATENYFEEQDSLGQWIAECCVQRQGAMGQNGTLYKAWCAFARESGETEGSQKAFSQALRKRGFPSARNGTLGRYFQGVDLRPWAMSDVR